MVQLGFGRNGNYVIKRLEWDSACFGYEVGEALLGNGPLDYNKFVEEAKAYQLVYIFSNIELTDLPLDLRKVDEKITLIKDLQPSFIGLEGRMPSTEIHDPTGEVYGLKEIESIVPPVKEFQKAFVELALISGGYSRFRTDERLRTGEYEKLYHSWADKTLKEDDKGFVFVKDREVLGMITLLTTPAGINRISLLAVRQDSRNQGLGRILLNKALATGTASGGSALSVTTQKANLAAMLLYQKMGFEIVEVCQVYHWWNG